MAIRIPSPPGVAVPICHRNESYIEGIDFPARDSNRNGSDERVAAKVTNPLTGDVKPLSVIPLIQGGYHDRSFSVKSLM